MLTLPFGTFGAYAVAWALYAGRRVDPEGSCKRNAFVALIWLGVGGGVFAWVVQLYIGPYVPRYLMGMAVMLVPPVAAWCATLLARDARARRWGWTAVGLLLFLQWSDPRRWLRPVGPMAEIAARIEKESRPDDLLYVFPANFGASFYHHYRGPLESMTPPYRGRVTKMEWDRLAADEEDPQLVNARIAELKAHLDAGKRVWVVAHWFVIFDRNWAYADGGSPRGFGRARMLRAEWQIQRRALRVLHAGGVIDGWWDWPEKAYHEPMKLVRFRPRRPDEPLILESMLAPEPQGEE